MKFWLKWAVPEEGCTRVGSLFSRKGMLWEGNIPGSVGYEVLEQTTLIQINVCKPDILSFPGLFILFCLAALITM